MLAALHEQVFVGSGMRKQQHAKNARKPARHQSFHRDVRFPHHRMLYRLHHMRNRFVCEELTFKITYMISHQVDFVCLCRNRLGSLRRYWWDVWKSETV